MIRVFSLVLALVFGLFAPAVLADESTSEAALSLDDTTRLTDEELSAVRGAAFGVGSFFYTRTITLGSWTLTFDGTKWTRTCNNTAVCG